MKFKKEAEVLNKLLKQKEQENTFSGVVYIKHKENTLFSSAYGYANRTWQVKNQLDTKFRIGSISKMFTAVAILKLVEDNKLKIEDYIHDYLELAGTQISKSVTIYHLLTHTSGIGDYYDEMNSTDDDWLALWQKKPIYVMKNLTDYYEMFKDKPPLFSPGEKYQYSGAGYILLGMLIEYLTGKKFDTYINEIIFDKLQLKDTKFIANDRVEIGVADGYEPVENNSKGVSWQKNIFTMTPFPASDGGATSTANDLVEFSRALRNNQLLNEVYTKLMLEPKVLDQNSNGFRGYNWQYSFANWFLLKNNKVVRYGHTGEEFGVSARLYYYPEKDIDVVILGNQGFCAGAVGWQIHDLIVEKDSY